MADRHSIQRQGAYRALRPLLLHGQIPGGSRLGEVEWAAKLQVHRGALREAFGLLVHEGLLRRGERGGHFVPTFERADLDEILELRAALEVAAIHRLGRRGEGVDAASLRALCRTMRQMAEARMTMGFAEADLRFHERIVELGGNQRMVQAYVKAPLVMNVRVDFSEDRRAADMLRTTREHERICDDLDAGRFAEAAEHLEQHLLTAHSLSSMAPPVL